MFSRPSRETGAEQPDQTIALSDDERARIDVVLSALTQPRLAFELAGQDEAVRAIAARVRPRRRRLRAPRIGLGFLAPRRPAAGIAVAACLFAATTGAAFAGVLPSAAQRVAHRAFDRLGVDVPGGAPHGTPVRATDGGGMSGTATDPATSGHDKGAAVSKTASDGQSRAGDDHGNPRGGSGSTGSAWPLRRRRRARRHRWRRQRAGLRPLAGRRRQRRRRRHARRRRRRPHRRRRAHRRHHRRLRAAARAPTTGAPARQYAFRTLADTACNA